MAVKVIRKYSNDGLQQVISVGSPISVHHSSITTFCTEVLQRGCDAEIPPTSKRPSADWSAHVRELVCNGIRVDAIREYQSICRGTSGRRPSQACTSSVATLLPSLRQPKILQLAGVAKGLIYLHDSEMVHGDLKGVSFRSLELLCYFNNLAHQGEHPNRRNRSGPLRRLRSTHDRLGPCKRPILELAYTRRHSTMDESGAN